jgi:hypothetical protein
MASLPSGSSVEVRCGVKTRELSNYQRLGVYFMLLNCYEDGVLKKGAIREVAVYFDVNYTTVMRIWKLALDHMENGRIQNLSILFKKIT